MIPSWLVWAEIKCAAALTKPPTNQFKPVQQRSHEVLRAYCPNIYTITLDSGIFNEFATAAFRFGHSLIPEGFKIKSHGLTKLLLNLNDTQSMVHKKQLVVAFLQNFNFMTLKNVQLLWTLNFLLITFLLKGYLNFNYLSQLLSLTL